MNRRRREAPHPARLTGRWQYAPGGFALGFCHGLSYIIECLDAAQEEKRCDQLTNTGGLNARRQALNLRAGELVEDPDSRRWIQSSYWRTTR